MNVLAEHIQKWVENGHAVVLAVEFSSRFSDYLSTLPWRSGGAGLDWGKIKGERFSLSALESSPVTERPALLEHGGYVVFWYSARELCIACDADFAAVNIDSAFWKAPGKRYIFRGEFSSAGEFLPKFERFAEYDGAEEIIAARE